MPHGEHSWPNTSPVATRADDDNGSVALHRFVFAAEDTILLGRESAGVPEAVHSIAGARVAIPLRRPARSLNVALAGAIALAEALRQTGLFPPP